MFAPKVNARRLRDSRKPSRAELESMVQERTKALRSLSVRLLQVQDEERRRIARELHDTAGQTLIALQLQVASVEQRLNAGRLEISSGRKGTVVRASVPVTAPSAEFSEVWTSEILTNGG